MKTSRQLRSSSGYTLAHLDDQVRRAEARYKNAEAQLKRVRALRETLLMQREGGKV